MAGISRCKSVEMALAYGSSLIGTPYQWWEQGGLLGDFGPFWVADDKAPPIPTVRAQCCTCAGLINLMRRSIGLTIPGLNHHRSRYAGGTWYWTNFLRRHRVLESFDGFKKYPRGTLLLRPFRSVSDQGHLAVVYSQHKKGVLYSQLLHAYATEREFNPGKQIIGAVTLDPAAGISHFWDPRGYYLYACRPENWLGIAA